MAVQTFTVTDLTRRIKLLLEGGVGRVWVEGEITGLRRQASGHCYFGLKDPTAHIQAVLFAGSQRGLSFVPADGQLVRACGDVTVYEPRGQYQLVIRQMEPGGQGALMARFEALKARLRAEGLFETGRKRPLPLLPRRIGIVTSPTGAAIRDVLTVLGRRFANVHVLIAPARVQGAGAAEEIAAALDHLNAVADGRAAGLHIPLDVLIVTRGGGSIEDLWPFNEEGVARAIVRSRLPVISAVGHEIDFTISDFAADVRAPTPSAAAEMVVGRKDDFTAHLASHQRNMGMILRQRLTEMRGRLEAARCSRVFSQPGHAVETAAQTIDSLAMRMRNATGQRLQAERRRSDACRARLLTERAGRFQTIRGRLERGSDRSRHALLRQAERRRQQVEALGRHLQALSPFAVLERGYSLTRLADGTLVRSVAQVTPGASLETRVADGTIHAVASHATQ